MRIVSTSYSKSPQYSDPEKWLEKIVFFTAILEGLAEHYEVISFEKISYEGELYQNNVKYYFTRQKKNTLRFPWRLHRQIKDLKPDIVFVNGLIFPLQIIQLRLKLGAAVKIILINRAEKPFTGIKRMFQKIADRFVNAYLFSSKEFGENWVRAGIISRIEKVCEVLPASSVFSLTDKSVSKNSLGISGKLVYLWVGRLEKNKDPLTVVKAFKVFLLQNPAASLYMIYQTNELLEEVKKVIAGTTRIILTGKIEHEDLQKWYSAADFIISGSHHEGGSIAVCEAMSCGCIPVVTDIISFRSMTGRGKCGILYEPGNETDLQTVLIKTQEMNLVTEKEKVLEQYNTELSVQAIVKKIEAVIAALK